MSTFDTETEKLIEAEVAKRTPRVRKLLLAMFCISLPCVACSLIGAYLTRKHVEEAAKASESAKRNAAQSEKDAQVALMHKEIAQKQSEAVEAEREKYEQLNVGLERLQAELAKTKEDSATCDRILASMQQIAATIKKNREISSQQLADAKDQQEMCSALAEKKLAECKKVCESANLPPFWPQRLTHQPIHPSLIS